MRWKENRRDQLKQFVIIQGYACENRKRKQCREEEPGSYPNRRGNFVAGGWAFHRPTPPIYSFLGSPNCSWIPVGKEKYGLGLLCLEVIKWLMMPCWDWLQTTCMRTAKQACRLLCISGRLRR